MIKTKTLFFGLPVKIVIFCSQRSLRVARLTFLFPLLARSKLQFKYELFQQVLLGLCVVNVFS